MLEGKVIKPEWEMKQKWKPCPSLQGKCKNFYCGRDIYSLTYSWPALAYIGLACALAAFE